MMTEEVESISEVNDTTLDTEVNRYLDSVDDARPSVDSSQYRYYPGAERDTYDYNNERFGMHKTTIVESIVHMIKGATGAGAGVMTMHEAFMYGGLWTSLGATFCIGLINTYIMYMVAKCAHLMYIRLRMSKLSYSDLAEVAAATGSWKGFRRFSKQFRFTVDILIALYMYGTCCVYQIIIANTFKQALEIISSDIRDWFNDDIRLYILISTPILMLLCLIRSLRFLAPFSILADIFIAVCILVTMYYSFQTNQNISDRPAWKNLNNFWTFCGICIYCTCGIAVCLPVENNMRQPRYFVHVLNWAMFIEVTLIALAGFFGYWGWGEDCRSPVNVHMPHNVFSGLLQLLLGLMLCVIFVVQFWVAFKIIWYYVSKRTSHHFSVRFERIFRLLFTLPVTCISILFPELIPLMAFIGLFILAFVNFIFPAFIELLITWNYDRALNIRWRIMKNCIIIIFGFVICGSAVYLTLVS